MFGEFLQGLGVVFQPTVLLFMFIGVVVGMVVGLLPGLGALTTVAILLPMLWKLSPEISLSLLLAILPAAIIAGSVTAILINLPGEDISVATLIDGYPMNQRGEGGRAIAAGVTASMLGGLASVALAFAMIPVVVKTVLAFGFSELLFLIVMGLSFVATLTGGSTIKGLIGGALGILISLIGFHPVTAVPRFTFGSLFLYDGLNLAVMMMGLFGLSEMLDLILTGQSTIAKVEAAKVKFRDMMVGVNDVMKHWWLWLRSTVIGYVIGIIPGVGSSVAMWISYGQAKQSSKNPEEFGTGRVEGVIAPQSSSNAVTAGSLLTTMVFGIPGSAVMAVIMGAFFMVGIPPGLSLVTDHLDLVFTLLLGLALANVIGGVICLASTRYLTKIVFVHMDYLFPVIMVIIFVAAFVTKGTILDFITVMIAGFLGLVMKRLGYSRAALCLGFVLGRLFEHYLLGSLKLSGPTFFLTPISLLIIAITIVLYTYGPIKRLLLKRKSRW